MLIKRPDDIQPGEITDRATYLNRRTLLGGMAAAASVALTGTLFHRFFAPRRKQRMGEKLAATAQPPAALADGSAGTPNTYEEITTYNNFYEFGTDKYSPAENAGTLRTRPWTVAIEGAVKRPRLFDIDELLHLFPLEERIYRFRCVEGWSMVIPWLGFPLASLVKAVEPTSAAKYVEFTTLLDPEQMPLQKRDVLDWPYVEGLRMDEAAHPLSLLAFGLYGEVLPNQNGAPVRLVVPWKYGFKSGKSIVKIRFVEEQPLTTWVKAGPDEYGFYSNVNPEVDHPRWSQARERRIGELGKRDTLMFNGYADQVASLYAGMDLRKHF